MAESTTEKKIEYLGVNAAINLSKTLIGYIDANDTKSFIKFLKEKENELNKPVYGAKGNTTHHSIARAIYKDEKEKLTDEEKKDLCTGSDEKQLFYQTGLYAYKIQKFINENDDVKRVYKQLFSDKYITIKNFNEKEYTPLYFAELCNPEFAQYMTPVKSPRSSSFKEAVINAASKLVKRATSSKRSASTKKTKPESAKDEDLTIEELEAKIRQLPLPVRHYVYNDKRDKEEYENSEEYKKEEEEYAAAYKRRYELEQILEKKILAEKKHEKKTKPSFFSRVSRAFEKKGGKTRKHKKTNKRRSYRRK
jgi:hypothetical protein